MNVDGPPAPSAFPPKSSDAKLQEMELRGEELAAVGAGCRPYSALEFRNIPGKLKSIYKAMTYGDPQGSQPLAVSRIN